MNLGHRVLKLILCISQHGPGCAAITNNPQVSVAENNEDLFLFSATHPTRVHRASVHHGHSVHLSHLADGAAAIWDFASCWEEGKGALEGALHLNALA